MLSIGFVVNPVAGMGGAVGLKGTDGNEILEEARRRGAEELASHRAEAALRSIASVGLDAVFLTCKGIMGEDAFSAAGLPCDVVCDHSEVTSSEDTKRAVRTFESREVDLIVFVGGDGTARDILEETATRVPMVGVPSGVKMHSAVFINTPDETGDLLLAFDRSRESREAEVMDVDEESFRDGAVRAKLYGVALTPESSEHVQAGKQSYSSGTASEEAEEIGQYVADTMQQGVTYVIGPGSTTAVIARILGQPKTLLGVDIYRDRVIVLADASESGILGEVETSGGAEIVVSPIGAQGFFFGRGNQQMSPKVIRAVGPENVTVVSTTSKLAGTPVLRVDTGDPALDDLFRGKVKVVTGYRRKRLVSVA